MRFLITIALALILNSLHAQNILERSLKEYQSGNLQVAKTLIDSAITSELYASENITWYLRGFIYKDIFKVNGQGQKADSIRRNAIDAFKRLLEMDIEQKYSKEVQQNLKYLATTSYTDAMRFIQGDQYDLANQYFTNFKGIYGPLADGTISMKESELRFYLAMGSGYVQIQLRDTLNDYSEKALLSFEKVLAIDSMNKEANYNIAVIYYNEAVNRILGLDYDDIDLLAFGKFEDETITLFKKSLPYMQRAYQADNRDKNVLEGLAGIHFSLREFDLSNRYKEELMVLEDR